MLKMRFSWDKGLGIALIAIGLLRSILAGIKLDGLLSLGAGLVMLLWKRSERVFNSFVNSFSLKLFLVFLLDAAFMAVALIAGITAGNISNRLAEGIAPQEIVASAFERENILRSLTIALSGIAVSYFALLLFAYTLLKGVAWLLLLEKPLKKGFFFRFGLVNLIWWALFLVGAVIAALGFTRNAMPYAMAALALLYFHFTAPLHYSFVQDPKHRFKTAFKKMLLTALTPRFALPYAYSLLVLVVLFQPFRFLMALFPQFAPWFSGVFVVFFLAWEKVFMAGALKEIERWVR